MLETNFVQRTFNKLLSIKNPPVYRFYRVRRKITVGTLRNKKKNMVAVPLPDYIQPNPRISRRGHSRSFCQLQTTKDYYKYSFFPLAIYLSLLSRSFSDHHFRCGGWLNLEFSKREKHSGWAIKTIYKK